MFEQSGTFKTEFLRLGIPAEDYDIQDDFGQTDHKVDLFEQIELAYDGKPSLFDGIGGGDLIMAFFPCIYFESVQMLYFMDESQNLRGLPKKGRYDTIIERAGNRLRLYVMLYKLVAVCDIRGLRLVIENPATAPHYLLFPCNFLKPTMIDQNRATRGDYYRKPTAYWFVNCEPTNGRSLKVNHNPETVTRAASSKKAGICSKERSMISPEYARNFICDFILGRENENSELTLFDD